MLKFAGSIVAGGVLGGASLLAADSNNVFLPAVVATVGFVGAMSLFSSLEQPTAVAEPVAAPQSKAAKKAAAAKREKKPFVRTPAPAPVSSPVAAESEPEEASEPEEEVVEEVKAAPKKKNKKKKAAAPAPEPVVEKKAAAKKAAPAEEKKGKVPVMPVAEKKEEKKGKGKKAAAEPVVEKKEEKKAKKAAPVEEKKVEKKADKKEEKKTAAKKAAPVEEKKGKKAAAVEEKKGKKEEKKAKKRVVESDEESPSADEDEGFTLVKSNSRKPKAKAAAETTEETDEDEKTKPVTHTMSISSKSHGVIIGANGDTLRLVQEGTGTRISMPKRESGSEQVSITGPLANVLAAKKCLKDLETTGFSEVTHPGQQIGELVLKEDKHKGIIIGPGGQNLRAIQNATNTRITMPPQNTTSLKVMITGSKDNVKRAKHELKALIADGFTPITHPTWIKKEIPFPRDQLRTLIGKKGQNIKHIQGVSKGARVNTPSGPNAAGEDVVSVVGTPEQVAIAEKEILRLIAPVEEAEPEAGWGEQAEYNEDDAWA